MVERKFMPQHDRGALHTCGRAAEGREEIGTG
jgi:hypothetical protein